GLPKVALHWPFLDFQCGPELGPDSFIDWWHRADRGEVEPFILVVEGSVPTEGNKPEGYWSGFGNDPRTGQPITTSEWLDRLPPHAPRVRAGGAWGAGGGRPPAVR